jgi:hypothetical protein
MPSLATKSRLLYWSLNLAGLLCAVVFVLVRVRGGSLLVINKAEYFNARDLYKHSFVDRFREDHPAFNRVTNKITAYMDRPENPPFAQAPIAIVGTSFSDFRFVRSFPEVLGDRLGQPVHFTRHLNPFHVLTRTNYQAGPPKVLIYEMAEKGIYRRFATPPHLEKYRREKPKPFWEVLDTGEAEKRYTALLQMSVPTHRLYRWIATWKFDHLGYISSLTPVYSTNPPVLFFQSEVDDSPASFHYRHREQEIAHVCDQVAVMRDQLKTRYNLDLVFLPIPNKISLYSELVFPGEPYNQFLPRVYDGLRARGVEFIDLYHPFRASTNFLFFASDTHWNEQGIALAAELTAVHLAARRPPAEAAP